MGRHVTSDAARLRTRPGPCADSVAEPDEADTTRSLLGVSFTYSVNDYYRTRQDEPAMSGWVIASVVGGLLGLLIIVLLAVISKAVKRTTENAALLVQALEQVRNQTVVLADLEAQSEHASQVVAEAESALRASRAQENEEGNGPGAR